MADDRLDGRAASHLAFDLRGDAALLLGRVDFEFVVGRRIVAAVSGIGTISGSGGFTISGSGGFYAIDRKASKVSFDR
jgi:hypothetical protein